MTITEWRHICGIVIISGGIERDVFRTAVRIRLSPSRGSCPVPWQRDRRLRPTRWRSCPELAATAPAPSSQKKKRQEKSAGN